MPTISKIRFAHVVYEQGAKQYQDEIFSFDGHNGAILLENGGGKTVFVQTAIQAVLPHESLGGRHIANTLTLSEGATHIAIEWILNERPRLYGLTAVTLFKNNQDKVDSYRFVNEYEEGSKHSIENIPLSINVGEGKKRPADRGEIRDYYQSASTGFLARQFDTIEKYHAYIEEHFQIIPSEWMSIVEINKDEGGVYNFFETGNTSEKLVEKLLIPIVEKSMPGADKNSFADTFQKQREHFKQHQILTRKIRESQALDAHVSQLVGKFQAADSCQAEYGLICSRLKTFWELTNDEIQKETEIIAQQDEKEADINLRQEDVKRIKSAADVLNKKNKQDEAEAEYNAEESSYNSFNEIYEKEKKEKLMLEIGQASYNYTQLKERLDALELEMDLLDKTTEVRELEAKLKQTGGAIKAALENKMELLQKEAEQAMRHCKMMSDQSDSQKRELNNLSEISQKEKGALEGIKCLADSRERDLEEIGKQRIPDYPKTTMMQMNATWTSRVNELNQELLFFEDEKKRILRNEIDNNEELEIASGSLKMLEDRIIRLEEQIRQRECDESDLKKNLADLRNEWQRIDVHQRQASLTHYFEDQLRFENQKLENIQMEERLASRYFDDYGELSIFTADPRMEKLLVRFGTRFKLLETGSSFLRRMDSAPKDMQNQNKGLWAMIVVTTAAEKDDFKELLRIHGSDLLSPVLVLSDVEACEILEHSSENIFFSEIIAPSFWHETIDEDSFAKWLSSQRETRELKKNDRLQKENEIKRIERAYEQLRQYFSKYTTEMVEKQRSEFSQSVVQREQYQNKQNQLIQRKEQFVQDHARIDKAKSSAEQELSELSQNLIEAKRFENIQAEVKRSKEEAKKLEKSIDGIGIQINKKKSLIDSLEGDIMAFKESARMAELEKGSIITGEWWRRVAPYHVQKAEGEQEQRTLTGLQGMFSMYNESLNQRQGDRQRLESERDRAAVEAARLDSDINEQCQLNGIKRHELSFDESNELRLKMLRQKASASDKKNQEMTWKLNDVKEKWIKEKSGYEVMDKQHQKIYGENYSIPVELERVSIWIEETTLQLKAESRQISKEKEKAINNLQTCENIERRLSLTNERHAFIAIEDSKELEESMLIELPYRRGQVMNELLGELDNKFESLNQANDSLEHARGNYKHFCSETISDRILRERAISGMESAKNLQDILRWQEQITKALNRAIELARQDLAEQDKEMVIFIGQMYTHICSVIEGIRMIPRSTRVRQGEGHKEIYKFDLPAWDEAEAKERLQAHLYKLIEELDSGRFSSEELGVRESEERKYIEKALKTQQLLGIVTGRRSSIRIACRKVNNEGLVSERYTSWEDSNHWSGGEKWSKNMALFLGILNFTAEKRVHVERQMKRNRSVIMDNPFGQASSDHVLKPVFFIAEQLGFQMITLTALAEGKYIRDYFPVVYSCRLENLKSGESQGIQKEKFIQKAWLKDHSPESIRRLGEEEQLNFFA